MDDAQKAANRAAAAADYTIILDGKKYVAKVPGAVDFFEQRNECRRRVMASAVDALDVCQQRIAAAEKAGKPLPQAMIDGMLKLAMPSVRKDKNGNIVQESKTEPSEDQLRNEAASPGMLKWWVWRLIKKANPQIDLDWVESVVSDDAVYELSQQIGEIIGLANLDPKSKASPTG